MPVSVIPGAEAWSVDGDGAGAVVVHGFTGTPATMRPVADALAEAGFAVSVPRLPGHGTTVDDMQSTRFGDWYSAVEAAWRELSSSCERSVAVGLSMGGTLICRLAARHPELAGVACINPLVEPAEPELKELVRLMLDAGETVAPGIGSDVTDPSVREITYDASPLAPALSLYEALDDLQIDLGRIACPVLVMTSTDDRVVHPHNSEHLAAAVTGPVERVTLARSSHVATIDVERDDVAARVVAFTARVTGRTAPGS